MSKMVNDYDLEFNYAHLAKLMRGWRLANGLMQYECDELLGLSKGMWGKYERNDRDRFDSVEWHVSMGVFLKMLNLIFDRYHAERLQEFFVLEKPRGNDASE